MINKPKSESKNTLYNSGAFVQALEKIKAGERVLKLSGLEGSSKFYLLFELSRELRRPIVYVGASKKDLESAAEDLSFYGEGKPPILRKREVRPKDALFSSHSNEMAERINWLYRTREGRILLAESASLFERFIPKGIFEKWIIELNVGDCIPRDDLIDTLVKSGYVRTDFVEKPGEISLRGAIVDVFSPGSQKPIRLEFLGDDIYSIRYFTIDDQKSTEKIERIAILPASEIILEQDNIDESLSYIRRKAVEQEITASVKLALIEEIGKGKRFPQLEYLLPSFYRDLDTVFDYIPPNSLFVLDAPEEISKSIEAFSDSLPDLEASLKRQLKITPAASELYLTQEELLDRLSRFQRLLVEDVEIADEGVPRVRFETEKASVAPEDEFDSPFEALSQKIIEWQSLSYAIYLVVQTEAEAKKFRRILEERSIRHVQIEVGALSSGFIFPEAEIVVVTEKEIFGEKKKVQPQPKREVSSAFITSFSELKPGDYIVHVDFGIGIFRGLTRLKIEDTEGDYLLCEYQGGDRIYVPVHKLKLVQRYIGDGSPPRIDKLGRDSWKKVVKRVKRAVESIAKELLELYARRKAESGFQFSKRDKLFKDFEFSFPYEETPDQEAALEDVMNDMESSISMDRLICGDVGFGKTEVALRAAFKAVMDGKQVALLVPTTLLAYQHFLTSTERLKGYPVLVEMLSRFRSGKEEREILKKLDNGSIDLIIGTHKLLSNKVQFKDLGLVIIDEEHRFGVKHKEKLRKLKKGVDVLSLSATPIPRSLQLSLVKIRDISLINTPPEGRQSVETQVFPFNTRVIRDAIMKEIGRGGQVFFIHNRIEDIFLVANLIKGLVPDVTIDVTHGRMRESVLEKSITRFIRGKTDVLVTTAIVESGLDIPGANTIIIDDAHTFGLADLYQLRGRVGRSEKKAYAYFLVPRLASLTPQAKRRLKAIGELRELGSGFKLALSDLEIRGAGNLFGTEQSGHIADVGLELYLEMLNKEVARLKEEGDAIDYEPEIRANIPAFIPDDYISDEAERLLFYKRLSSISRDKELREIKAELNDRFGNLPEPVINLCKLVGLKLLMRGILVERIEIKEEQSVIIFSENSPFRDRFMPGRKLRIYHENEGVDALREIKRRLLKLTRSGVVGVKEAKVVRDAAAEG